MGKAIYFGIDNIIGALDRLCQGEGGFYYCVWQNSKSKCFQYNGGNYEEGIDYLKENLEPYAEAGYVGDLYLKLHPNPCKHFFTWATEDICTLMICPTSKDINPGQLSGNYGLQQQQYPQPMQKGGKLLMTEEQWQERETLKNLPQTIAGLIQTEIAKLSLPEAQPEPEADTMQSVMIGHLKNPQLISQMLDVVGQLIPMLKNPAAGIQQIRQVAGVPGVAEKTKSMEIKNTVTDGDQNKEIRSDIVENNYTAESEVTLTEDQEKEMIAYNTRVDDALRRLALIPGFDLADDLTALANYAEKNPDTFNSLLPIVRNG